MSPVGQNSDNEKEAGTSGIWSEVCPGHQELERRLATASGPGLARLLDHIDTCAKCRADLDILAGVCASESQCHDELSMTKDNFRAIEVVEATCLPGCHSSANRMGDKRIGPFQVQRLLGEGGMGQVFDCLDTRLNRHVAVKWIKNVLIGPAMIDRFRREARIHAGLNHPNILRLLEFGIENDSPYFATELVESGTIKDAITSRRLTLRESAEILSAAARGVAYAHEHGVLHLDLKPANILLVEQSGSRGSPRWTPKIMDFGLAKELDQVADASQSTMYLGTPAYMAPEQVSVSAERVGPATDIYALGAILYECITGSPPFRSESTSSLFARIRDVDPVEPGIICPGLSQDLETICLKCLEKLPSRRYATAAALADDLDRYLERRPILARRTGPFGRVGRWAMRNRALAATTAMVAVSLSVMAAGGVTFALREMVLRREADQARSDAQYEKRLAEIRYTRMRDRYFANMTDMFLTTNRLREVVWDRVTTKEAEAFYYDLSRRRFDLARQVVEDPTLSNEESEFVVEANYLWALKVQETDQARAADYFRKAIALASRIASERRINDMGRFCAINSLNYLGVYRVQANDFVGAARLFRESWDRFCSHGDDYVLDILVKKFSILVASNLVQAYYETGRDDDAETMLQALTKLDKVPVLNGQSERIAY
jgi:hypothetical protein